MKLKREKAGFEPITITVETVEEAIVLWQRMNLCHFAVREDIESQSQNPMGFDRDADDRVSTAIWEALNMALIDAGERDDD